MKTPLAIPTATMLAAMAFPVLAEQERPPAPEPLRITVTEAPLEFEVVANETYFWMAALPEFAVLVQPRSLSILRPGSDTPEPASDLLEIPDEIDYFGVARAVEGHILISVGSYDEERRRKEAATPRGGFVGGPKPAGLLVITADPPAVRWIKTCRVIHWPEPCELDKDIAGAPHESLVPAMQDARLIDDKLHIADYGRLGILDLEKKTWHGLDADWAMHFSRVGPVKDTGGRLFIGCDEGGLAGGFIKWLDGAKQDTIPLSPASVPGEILGHGGRIFVTTDQGLAEITDPGGKPVVRHFVNQNGNSPIGESFSLIAHDGTLFVAAVSRLLRFDPAKKTATVHQLPEGTEFYRLHTFDGHLHVLVPDKLARIPLP